MPPKPRPRLVKPSNKYAPSYLAALKEGFGFGSRDPLTAEEIAAIEKDFNKHIRSLNRRGGTVQCDDGITRPRVPSDTYWLVEGAEFIGTISLRHTLNDFLELFGGHIGYSIRPSKRRQGYGTAMLRLTLDKARALGLERVMISTAEDNRASRLLIESCGGELADIRRFPWREGGTCIYWVRL